MYDVYSIISKLKIKPYPGPELISSTFAFFGKFIVIKCYNTTSFKDITKITYVTRRSLTKMYLEICRFGILIFQRNQERFERKQ